MIFFLNSVFDSRILDPLSFNACSIEIDILILKSLWNNFESIAFTFITLWFIFEYDMNSLANKNSRSSLQFTWRLSIDPFFRRSLMIQLLFREFTIYFANLLWIPSVLRELTFYSANSFSIAFEFNSLWIHYLFRELTIISLSISLIHYEFTIDFATSH